MMRQFIIVTCVAAMVATFAGAQEQGVEDGEVVIYTHQERFTRCDGVTLVNDFPGGNQLFGQLSVETPDGQSIIYGEFAGGDVVEFGFLNAEPVYVEDTNFDFYQWVNTQLKKRGYAPWTEENMKVSCESI